MKNEMETLKENLFNRQFIIEAIEKVGIAKVEHAFLVAWEKNSYEDTPMIVPVLLDEMRDLCDVMTFEG